MYFIQIKMKMRTVHFTFSQQWTDEKLTDQKSVTIPKYLLRQSWTTLQIEVLS